MATPLSEPEVERTASSPGPDDASTIGNSDGYISDAPQRPETPSQPDEKPASTDSEGVRVTSPTSQPAQGALVLAPYIIVTCNDTVSQTALGRTGVARIGYRAFAEFVFDAFLLHPSRAPKSEFSLFKKSDRAIFKQVRRYLRADFVARAKFRPQFASRSSGVDSSVEQSLCLQSVGWPEMVQNLISVRAEYQVPEEYPGKAELQRILRQVPKDT